MNLAWQMVGHGRASVHHVLRVTGELEDRGVARDVGNVVARRLEARGPNRRGSSTIEPRRARRLRDSQVCSASSHPTPGTCSRASPSHPIGQNGWMSGDDVDVASDQHPDEAIERSGGSRALAVAAAAVAAVLLATGIGRLGLGEPTDLDTDLFTATIGAIGLGSVAVFAVIGLRRGQRRLFVLPLVGLFGLLLAARYADDLHWRLSRDEFEAVLNGDEVPCPSEGDCRLGWWKSYGEERIDSMVIVWIPDEFCYAGLGIAHPVGDDPGSDTMRDLAVDAELPSDYVTVSPWRDGWYQLCLTN
jgi:hypothetical protein